MNTRELTTQLVTAFGKPDEVLALLTDDTTWALHIGSMEPGGTYKGLTDIRALMEKVFGEIYDPASVEVTIHTITGDDTQAAVRFNLKTKTTWGLPYDNEYAVFTRCSNGKIIEINEYLDGFTAMDQLSGES